jgi:hypothetical protein
MNELLDRCSVEDVIERELADGFAMGPFHRHWLMERAPEKVRRNLELAKKYPHIVNARQGFASMDANDGATASFAAINTTTTETSLVGNTQATINQFCALAVADARAGKVYKVNAYGAWGNTGTPTIIWTPRWGTSTTQATNVTLGASATLTTITGITALPWYLEFIGTVLTSPPGATTATFKGRGIVFLGIPATSSQTVQPLQFGGTSATVDTSGQGTAGSGIQITVTWGTSSASNTVTCDNYILRSLN